MYLSPEGPYPLKRINNTMYKLATIRSFNERSTKIDYYEAHEVVNEDYCIKSSLKTIEDE